MIPPWPKEDPGLDLLKVHIHALYIAQFDFQQFTGWGEYLKYSVDLEVVNDAIAGRSARSYTEEGRFQALADVVESGDFVIIEFGHNDGGSLSTTTDNLRTDCYGAGTETCVNGTGAIIQTYPTYITQVAAPSSSVQD